LRGKGTPKTKKRKNKKKKSWVKEEEETCRKIKKI
jgi:hypothetical protein